MKALSVQQPWAWAIVAGLKRIENRSRPTSYRGPLLIHAGLNRRQLVPKLPDGTDVPAGLDFGAVIGRVELVDCVPYDQVAGDAFAIPGHWCWILANPVALEPVPWKGQLGFFEVPDPTWVPEPGSRPNPS